MKKTLILLSIFFVQTLFAQKYNYPETPKIPVYDTIWGKVIQDDYRWMEDLKDSKVKEWFVEQNNFAENYLNKLNGMDGLIAEWKMFDRLRPYTYHYISHWIGDKIFYRKFSPGEILPKYIFSIEKTRKKHCLLTLQILKGKRLI